MNSKWKILILLTLVAICCSRQSATQQWYVTRLQISDKNFGEDAAFSIGKEELQKELADSLGRSRRFVLLPSPQKTPPKHPSFGCALLIHHLGQTIKHSEPKRQMPVVEMEAEVFVEIDRVGSPERWDSRGVGKARFSKEAEKKPAIRRALALAIDKALEDQIIQLEAVGKTDSQLIQDLANNDARISDSAVWVLADRKNSAVLPALIARLQDGDRSVAMHAVGAIHAMGDRRAVSALVEMSESRDPRFMLALVEVVASLGGQDAEAFLFTVASGHPEDTVRQAADQALQRMKLSGVD